MDPQQTQDTPQDPTTAPALEPGAASPEAPLVGEVLPAHPVAFDADKRAADRAKKGYRIDGVIYSPTKKTGRIIKQIIEMAPDKEPEEGDTTSQTAGIDLLYQQVAILLRDADDNQPDWERLMDELDLEDARDMIAVLMGNTPEDASGNDATPAS